MRNIQEPYYTLYKLHYGGSREARDTKQKSGGHGAKRRSPERYDLSRERIFHNRRRALQAIPRVGQFSLYKSNISTILLKRGFQKMKEYIDLHCMDENKIVAILPCMMIALRTFDLAYYSKTENIFICYREVTLTNIIEFHRQYDLQVSYRNRKQKNTPN